LGFTLNDLENGILRGNRAAPYTLGNLPFADDDDDTKKQSYALDPRDVDERIHFALNCGAASCPPVKKFTPLGLREELRIVAAAFCENGVHVDEGRRVVTVSRIFQWYRVDFEMAFRRCCQEMEKNKVKNESPTLLEHDTTSSSLQKDVGILKMISAYLLQGDKKEALDRMIMNTNNNSNNNNNNNNKRHGSIRLKYSEYDWGHDASKFKVYRGYTDVLSDKTPINSFLSHFF